MTTAILLAILLSNPNTLCHKAHAKVVVKAAKKAGLKYDIPPSLLLSVVVAETGCRNVVATGRGKGRRGSAHNRGRIYRRGRSLRRGGTLRTNRGRAPFE